MKAEKAILGIERFKYGNEQEIPGMRGWEVGLTKRKGIKDIRKCTFL